MMKKENVSVAQVLPQVSKMLEDIIANVERVIVGKRDVISLAVCALLCGGHVLIEDMPGLGKTSLVSAIAKSFDCSFTRIQFTPDILPSDITGFSMYNQKTGEFDFKKGGVWAQMVLADELNRTSPKTQASLLEAMEEGQVTVDGKTYLLPKPFQVFATQNPREYLGTYPLPEAQLDRFFIRISMGYPSFQEERDMLERYKRTSPLKSLSPVANAQALQLMQEIVPKVHVEQSVGDYIVSLVRATRKFADIRYGASPRATLALYRGAQAQALLNGRDYVIPDDVQKMAVPVLEHRIALEQGLQAQGQTKAQVMEEVLMHVKAPR